MEEKERADEEQRTGEYDIADIAEISPRLLRNLVRQDVQDHSRPACIAAPAAAEEQRTADLGDQIVDDSSFKDSKEQVVPEPFDLHIFLRKKSQIYQHVESDCKLHHVPGIRVSVCIQSQACCQARADIGKVKKIKDIIQREPEGDGDGLENQPHDQRKPVLIHIFRSAAAQQAEPPSCSDVSAFYFSTGCGRLPYRICVSYGRSGRTLQTPGFCDTTRVCHLKMIKSQHWDAQKHWCDWLFL